MDKFNQQPTRQQMNTQKKTAAAAGEKLEVRKAQLFKTDPFALELEALMLRKLVETEMNSEAIACFVAAQRVNGALRKNLTPYQFEVERDLWTNITPGQIRVLFPIGEIYDKAQNLRGKRKCGICGAWSPTREAGEICVSCRDYPDRDMFENI